MPVQRRTPRILIALLAVPVIAAVYLAVAAGRAMAAARTVLATMLGVTVIGAVYADEAWRRAPAPARRASLPAALAAALALTLVGALLPPAQVEAHDPAKAVVKAALQYLDRPYVWGAEGPRAFDCSGLVYRAFKDAGELPLIGGARRTARAYFRWFANRGLTSKRNGRPGDLVVYGSGKHIGIYLGDGKVVSALTRGVSIHRLHALQNEFTTFLRVDWGGSRTSGGGSGGSSGGGDSGSGGEDAAADTADTAGGAGADSDADSGRSKDGRPKGFAFGSLNVRKEPDPDAPIISWVTRGSTFTILETGRSPSGALWLRVEKANGKQGWIWARWTRVIEGSLDE